MKLLTIHQDIEILYCEECQMNTPHDLIKLECQRCLRDSKYE